jgi:hypothetical protein
MAAGTTTQLRAAHAAQDTEVFLDVDALAARYGIGRGKSYELVASPGFPKSVVPGVYRIPLVALRVWELAHSLEATVADRAPLTLAPPPPRPAGRPAKAVAS